MPVPGGQVAITDDSATHVAFGLAILGNRPLALVPTKALDGRLTQKRHSVEKGKVFNVDGRPGTVIRSSYDKSLTVLLLQTPIEGSRALGSAEVARGDALYAHDGTDWVELSVVFAAPEANIKLARVSPSDNPEVDGRLLVGASLWREKQQLVGIIHDATGGGRFVAADVRQSRRALPYTDLTNKSPYQPILSLQRKLSNVHVRLKEHESTGVSPVTKQGTDPCHDSIVSLMNYQADRDAFGGWLVDTANELQKSYVDWMLANSGVGGVSPRQLKSKNWPGLRAAVFGELPYLEAAVLGQLAVETKGHLAQFDQIVYAAAGNPARVPQGG